MRAVEFWVMRIVHTAAEIAKKGAAIVAMQYSRQLAGGELNYVNGDIVEPIEMLHDQEAAIARAVEFTARTGKPAKVVMNADLDAEA